MEQESADRGSDVAPESHPSEEVCDVCGSSNVTWRKCKLMCLNCGTILKSCADL